MGAWYTARMSAGWPSRAHAAPMSMPVYMPHIRWIMENYAAGACADGGRPVITLRRLMSRFILIIAVSVLSSRYSHYLEFVG